MRKIFFLECFWYQVFMDEQVLMKSHSFFCFSIRDLEPIFELFDVIVEKTKSYVRFTRKPLTNGSKLADHRTRDGARIQLRYDIILNMFIYVQNVILFGKIVLIQWSV